MNVQTRPSMPLLDNEVLKTFIAIAETGNFSTAADAVFRTPSAVSMQIKKLEEQLGVSLFLRDARSVSLTKQGETLLSYARNILALSNEAVSQFIMPELSGIVKLGAPEDLGERLLPSILKDFAKTHPALMVDVTIDMSSSILKRMEEGRLDLALINCCSAKHTEAPGETVFRERLVWMGAKGGIAHKRDPLPISIWEEGCIWRADVLKKLEESGRPYRIAYMSEHMMAQRAAVMSDLAIAPFPLSYLNDDMRILGEAEGFTELSYFDIRLLTGNVSTQPIEAVARSIRLAFNEKIKTIAA